MKLYTYLQVVIMDWVKNLDLIFIANFIVSIKKLVSYKKHGKNNIFLYHLHLMINLYSLNLVNFNLFNLNIKYWINPRSQNCNFCLQQLLSFGLIIFSFLFKTACIYYHIMATDLEQI